MDAYYSSGRPEKEGVLTVNRCAETLNLSPNYFGDLIKKETAQAPKDYIQKKSMNVAKEMPWQSKKSISEIAYALGYQSPQYFTRAFKKAIGLTPIKYRNPLITYNL